MVETGHHSFKGDNCLGRNGLSELLGSILDCIPTDQLRVNKVSEVNSNVGISNGLREHVSGCVPVHRLLLVINHSLRELLHMLYFSKEFLHHADGKSRII